jgi:transposase-like protein
MKGYQKKENEVKGSIALIDPEKLMETAASGFLNLLVELGFEVMRQILEVDVEALAGERGKHDPNRTAYRHGNERTKVVLGGEKRSITKPRVRSTTGEELMLPSLAFFQNEDSLTKAVLAKLLHGVSTRQYANTSVQFSKDSACISKSEVSRRFIAGLAPMFEEFMKRRIDGDYVAVMLDGMNIGEMTVLAAMGILKDGSKKMLGIIEGASENHVVAKALLSDLVNRGLPTDSPLLFALDGSKALRKAVIDTFGKYATIQRCQVHKKRNVLSHLPKSEQNNVGLAISRAYLEFDYETAKRELSLIANNLEYRYPTAANSLREGLEETLTVHRLKIPALLRQTLCSTNPIESANSACMGIMRRIKNWRNGEMILRNIAVGFLEAEKGFRRIKGYKQISVLSASLFSHINNEVEQNIGLSA